MRLAISMASSTADRLNAHRTDRQRSEHTDSLARILQRTYEVPDSLCDTLLHLLPRFSRIAAPQRADVDAALLWLKARKQVRKGYNADTLFRELLP